MRITDRRDQRLVPENQRELSGLLAQLPLPGFEVNLDNNHIRLTRIRKRRTLNEQANGEGGGS